MDSFQACYENNEVISVTYKCIFELQLFCKALHHIATSLEVAQGIFKVKSLIKFCLFTKEN